MKTSSLFAKVAYVLVAIGPAWTSDSRGGDVGSAVKVWEEPLVVPTYKTGPPLAVPIFFEGRTYQGASGRVYPYRWVDELSQKAADVTYNAVYLENEYVKICVLPERDGRIFSAVDKTNGYDFFYRQHVIKPAMIGMTGAWISGGVEWNVPHHHRPSTNERIDYTITTGADGSKTIWVGEIERHHRLKWILGLTLRPNRSYLECTFRLFNRTPWAESFLFFQNPAVHANDQYQVLFPPDAEWAVQHAKVEFIPWPIATGRYGGRDYDHVDISWYKNLSRYVSFFCYGSEADYFGGYDHGREAGVAYVADRHVSPGKKLWTFGCGDGGDRWHARLSDTDGPYIELMAGSFSDNQPDYSWCQPTEVKYAKQYWFPIQKLGGMKYANLNGAVNLDLAGGSVAKVRINTTTPCDGAIVTLENRGAMLLREVISVAPGKPYAKDVTVSAGTREEDLCVRLCARGGEELLRYQPAKKRGMPRPESVTQPLEPKEIKTIEELYLTGLRLEEFHHPRRDPVAYYEEALRRDPGDYRVNTALGIRDCKNGVFASAEKKLRTAVERSTGNHTRPKDGEALYYLGVACKAQDKLEAAYDAFARAAWSLAWHSASCQALAEIDCLRGDFTRALAHLDRSLTTGAENTKARGLKIAVLRKLGRLAEAKTECLAVAAIDPLDYLSRNELFLTLAAEHRSSPAQDALAALSAVLHGNVQGYMELALDYANCGLWSEAAGVLKLLEPSQGRPGAKDPTLYYHLAYYCEKLGDADQARKYYRTAAEMPPEYCFPYQVESIAVLTAAMEENPADARAPYYLGNLLYDRQPAAAIAAWEKSRQLDPSFSLVHRNLGFAYSRFEKNGAKGVASYEKAVACPGCDARACYELDGLYEEVGAPVENRYRALNLLRQTVLKRFDSTYRLARVCVQSGRYDEALDLLKSRYFFVVAEGGGYSVREVYIDARLLRGLSSLRAGRAPEALEDFKQAEIRPANMDDEAGFASPAGDRLPFVQYCLGLGYEAMGDQERARACFDLAAAEKTSISRFTYYRGLALRKLGRDQQARDLLDRVAKSLLDKPEPTADFFAKFGEGESLVLRRADRECDRGVAMLASGRPQEAEPAFRRAIEIHPGHAWAREYLSETHPQSAAGPSPQKSP